MQDLQFEYVNAVDVYEFENISTVLSCILKAYRTMIRGGDYSYVDFALHMKAYLRYLPSSLTEKPIDVRCNEEALRIKALNIIFTRPDLIHHFHSKEKFTDEDAEALLSCFHSGDKPTVSTSTSPKNWAHKSIKTKEKIRNLINTLPYNSSEGLLLPAIPDIEELDKLFAGEKCKQNYTCTNQAQLSRIFRGLAKNGILDISDYLQTICQADNLWTRGYTRKGEYHPPRPLTPGDFTSAQGQIVSGKSEYTTIDEIIGKVAGME